MRTDGRPQGRSQGRTEAGCHSLRLLCPFSLTMGNGVSSKSKASSWDYFRSQQPDIDSDCIIYASLGLKPHDTQRLLRVFNKIDFDKNGSISRLELLDFFNSATSEFMRKAFSVFGTCSYLATSIPLHFPAFQTKIATAVYHSKNSSWLSGTIALWINGVYHCSVLICMITRGRSAFISSLKFQLLHVCLQFG